MADIKEPVHAGKYWVFSNDEDTMITVELDNPECETVGYHLTEEHQGNLANEEWGTLGQLDAVLAELRAEYQEQQ